MKITYSYSVNNYMQKLSYLVREIDSESSCFKPRRPENVFAEADSKTTDENGERTVQNENKT